MKPFEWAHDAQKHAVIATMYGASLFRMLSQGDKTQVAVDEEGCGALMAAAIYGSGPDDGMVDMGDSKSPAARRASSSLAPGTTSLFCVRCHTREPCEHKERCPRCGIVRITSTE